jgi:hypothetical protein
MREQEIRQHNHSAAATDDIGITRRPRAMCTSIHCLGTMLQLEIVEENCHDYSH